MVTEGLTPPTSLALSHLSYEGEALKVLFPDQLAGVHRHPFT